MKNEVKIFLNFYLGQLIMKFLKNIYIDISIYRQRYIFIEIDIYTCIYIYSFQLVNVVNIVYFEYNVLLVSDLVWCRCNFYVVEILMI